jgi:cysteine desulfurase/selenocysteine lyase
MRDTIHTTIDEFPILKHGHYANHAAIAPWPASTSQAVADFALENCNVGPQHYARWLLRETQLRQKLCDWLNAESAEDIALLKNTTEGICTVANGIEWRKGDNVILPLGEFPSNRLPWLALQELGVEVREVDIESTTTPEKELIACMDDRTRLLSVSAVQWTDGLRMKLEVLGDACQKNEVLFFVDAIQQLGAVSLDVQACKIDFLAADGHKWMLAPEGIAVFYCQKKARQQLTISQKGWRMVDNPYQFNRQDWQPSDAASRFEGGSPNSIGQTALLASIKMFEQFGMNNVEAAVWENSQILSGTLSAIPGIELVRPFEQQRSAGIVSFKAPGKDLLEIHRALKQKHLACAVRGGLIRLSPHFYQAGEPLQKMLTVIEDVLTKQ